MKTDAIIQPLPGKDCVTGQPIDVVHVDDCRAIEASLMLSLRDYFAAHAPNPPAWWRHDANNEDQFYKWRWHYADTMLAERDKA